jgi:hypothetical protein
VLDSSIIYLEILLLLLQEIGLISSIAAVKLDEDGILMTAIPKPDGYSSRFDPTLFPAKDIRLDVSRCC